MRYAVDNTAVPAAGPNSRSRSENHEIPAFPRIKFVQATRLKPDKTCRLETGPVRAGADRPRDGPRKARGLPRPGAPWERMSI